MVLDTKWYTSSIRNGIRLEMILDSKWHYTQRNLFEILLNQPEIRFYLPFSERFGTANGLPFGPKSIGTW